VLRPPRDLPPDFDFDFALNAVGAEEVGGTMLLGVVL
jgi:hypothetical protein